MKQAIHTWKDLNLALRGADEKQCQEMLRLELKGPKRRTFTFRIHSRLNKVRADRERLELEKKLK